MMDLTIHQRTAVVNKRAGKAVSVAALAVVSLFLGGCATFDRFSGGGSLSGCEPGSGCGSK